MDMLEPNGKVDGLERGPGKTDDHDDNDPDAAARHARRLQMRRKRAAHAAEEDSYGCGVVLLKRESQKHMACLFLLSVSSYVETRRPHR